MASGHGGQEIVGAAGQRSNFCKLCHKHRTAKVQQTGRHLAVQILNKLCVKEGSVAKRATSVRGTARKAKVLEHFYIGNGTEI